MSLPTFNRLEEAEKQVSHTDILDEIAEKIPDFGSRIQQAREQGVTDSDIFFALKEGRKRTPGVDVAASVSGEAISGVAGAPRQLYEATRGFGEFIKDPRTSLGNLLRGVFGFEPQEPEPSPAESILGKEKAQQLKESLGFKKIEDLIGQAFTGGVPGIQAGPFFSGLQEAPSRQDIRGALESTLGVDIKGQTPIGRILGEFTGKTGEMSLLPGAAQFGAGAALAQGERELGLPEGLARFTEFGVPLVSFRAPPKRAPNIRQLTKKEITNNRVSSLQKQFAPIESLGEDLSAAKVKPIRERIKADLEPIDAAKIAEESRNTEIRQKLRQLDTVERTRGQALEVINNAISEEFTRAQAITSNFYNSVRSKIGNRSIAMGNTLKEMTNFLEQLPTTGIPEATRNTIARFIQDQINLFDEAGRISVDNAIAMKQRFNNFVDFQFPDLQAKGKFKNVVNPIRKAARQELNDSIRALDREAYVDWRRAEISHAQDAERFGRDTVIKIQRGEDPVKVIGAVTDPAEFKALKDALQVKLSDTHHPAMSTLEKLALEETALGQTTPESSRRLADIKRNLSPQGREAANFIEEARKPLSPQARKAATQEAIVKEVAQAADTGSPLTTTIKLGQTPEGLKLIRETLQGTKALPIVEKAIVDNILSDVFFTKGEFNPEALRKLFRDKEAIKVIEMIEGPQYISRLRNLEKEASATKRAWNKIESEKKALQERAKLKAEKKKEAEKEASKKETEDAKFFKNPGKFIKENPHQYLMGYHLLQWMGIPIGPIAGILAGKELVKRLMPRILANKQIFNQLKIIQKNPNAFRNGMIKINQEIGKIARENSVKED